MKHSQTFCVFPALGYWEIDGKPVSSKDAEYGLNPHAIWKPTEAAAQIGQDMDKDMVDIPAIIGSRST